MEFIDIQRHIVDNLVKIPAMQMPQGRSTLFDGLPDPNVNRDFSIARVDLNLIIGGLQRMGRLNQQGGARPVVVLVDNALAYVPDGSDIAQELEEAKRRLTAYYGGDAQSEIDQVAPDLEALVFGPQRDNRLAFSFVEGARRTARSVTRLMVPRIFDGVKQPGFGYGTGWLIAPGILITNHHVVDNRLINRGEQHAAPADFDAQAGGIEAWFDYYDEKGSSSTITCGTQVLASSLPLDYAILKLANPAPVADRAPLPVIQKPAAFARGARMNIVQHGGGGPLKFAIRNNFFVRLADQPQFIRYQTDSEPGASGSPVCNDSWEVVGLHHAATPVPKEKVPQEYIDGEPATVTLLNEAIAIHSVLGDLGPDLKQMILDAQPHS